MIHQHGTQEGASQAGKIDDYAIPERVRNAIFVVRAKNRRQPRIDAVSHKIGSDPNAPDNDCPQTIDPPTKFEPGSFAPGRRRDWQRLWRRRNYRSCRTCSALHLFDDLLGLIEPPFRYQPSRRLRQNVTDKKYEHQNRRQSSNQKHGAPSESRHQPKTEQGSADQPNRYNQLVEQEETAALFRA